MLGVAALGSLGMGIYGAVNGPPASGVQLPQSLPHTGAAANDAFSGIGNLGQFNTFGQFLPQATSTAQGLFNNPYSGNLQGAANMFSPLAMSGGLNTFNAGNQLFGGSTALMNQAFDPNQALYNRTAQQVQDQTRVGLEARGVDSTPYGAGVEGQTMSNFNIDWQNNQLQRMLAGLGGAGQGYGQASNLQQQAPVQFMQGAELPYSTFGMIGGNQLGALTSGGQFGQSASTLPQQQVQDYTGYAQGNQQLANVTAGLGLQQAQLGFNQTQATGQGIGWGLGALGNTRFNPFSVGNQANAYNNSQNQALTGWGSYFGNG